MIQLETASDINRLDNYFKRVIGIPRLLVIDEFGYVKFSETQANLFFQIINKNCDDYCFLDGNWEKVAQVQYALVYRFSTKI